MYNLLQKIRPKRQQRAVQSQDASGPTSIKAGYPFCLLSGSRLLAGDNLATFLKAPVISMASSQLTSPRETKCAE
jgi:hypothetical protein